MGRRRPVACGCALRRTHGRCREGAGYFREIIRSHPDGDRAGDAFLYLATLAWWEEEWNEAECLHRAFLEKYPESPFKEEFLTVGLPAIAAKSDGLVRSG